MVKEASGTGCLVESEFLQGKLVYGEEGWAFEVDRRQISMNLSEGHLSRKNIRSRTGVFVVTKLDRGEVKITEVYTEPT